MVVILNAYNVGSELHKRKRTKDINIRSKEGINVAAHKIVLANASGEADQLFEKITDPNRNVLGNLYLTRLYPRIASCVRTKLSDELRKATIKAWGELLVLGDGGSTISCR